jgi:hypothetical protein
VKGNSATDPNYYSGAVNLWGATSTADVSFDGVDVLFTANTTAASVSLGTYNAAAFTVASNASATLEEDLGAAVTNNDNTGVAVTGGTFESIGVDFGTTSATDNEVNDIRTLESEYMADGSADFICNETRCSNDLDNDGDPTNDEYECTIGATGSSVSTTGMLWASMIKADRSSTIESFEVYTNASSICSLDYYLLEQTSSSTKFTVLWRSLNQTGSGTGWRDSGHIGLAVEPGVNYSGAVGVNCSSGSASAYYSGSSGTTKNAGFGDTVGYIADTNYSTEVAVGSTLVTKSTALSTNVKFMTRFNLNDLDTSSTSSCSP